MKYLLLGLIVFLFYRFFNPPKRLGPGKQKKELPAQEEDSGEYADYEEIE